MKRISIISFALSLLAMLLSVPCYAQTQALDIYEQPVVYPMQQEAVGEACLSVDEGDAVTYILYNKVLAASFVHSEGTLLFGGSEAMNLLAGTEPFRVAFGDGSKVVAASEMTLKSVQASPLAAVPNAVNGAKHFAGQQIEAKYEYSYGGSTVDITWRAVLRDGSHYLRTEMELTGRGDVNMHHIVPMLYSVDTKEAGSVPAVVGNTRGSVLMSNRIFAGLETPMAYNTVGEASMSDDNWEYVNTPITAEPTASSWTQVGAAQVPARVTEATGYGYPNIYAYSRANVSLKKNQKVEVTIAYKSGNHRLNCLCFL